MEKKIEIEKFGVNVYDKTGLEIFLPGIVKVIPKVEIFTSEEIRNRVRTILGTENRKLLKENNFDYFLNLDSLNMVILNYPSEVLAKHLRSSEDARLINFEMINLMIMSAGCFGDIAVLTDPYQYDFVLEELKKEQGQISLETRKKLAIAAWQKIGEIINIIPGWMIKNEF